MIAAPVRRIERHSCKQLGDSRGRHGKTSVGHLDRTAADMQRRANETFDLEQVETDRGAHDIDDRIKRAHFVKVNVIDGFVVHARFGFREPRKDLHR
jgi:hypothetical protein